MRRLYNPETPWQNDEFDFWGKTAALQVTESLPKENMVRGHSCQEGRPFIPLPNLSWASRVSAGINATLATSNVIRIVYARVLRSIHVVHGDFRAGFWRDCFPWTRRFVNSTRPSGGGNPTGAGGERFTTFCIEWRKQWSLTVEESHIIFARTYYVWIYLCNLNVGILRYFRLQDSL
jgi:hypothetical protein